MPRPARRSVKVPHSVVDRIAGPFHPHFPGFTPSAQQAAFLETVSAPGPSIVLEAVAGAGKTTTLIEGMRRMAGTVAFIAFNKKIVAEIEEKAKERGVFDPSRHTIKTCHGIGFSAILARGTKPKVQVQEKKCLYIARDMAAKDESLDKLIPVSVPLVGLAKQALLPTTKEAQPLWAALARRHSLDDAIPKGRTMRETVVFAQRILIESNKMRDVAVDFDDMVYLPAAFDDYPIRRYDWVLVDEAQDTNAARRVLARKLLAPGGRLCAVGDRHQALYAFTGADSAALDLIAEEFDAIRLPLSVSYRCPRAVVAEARQHVAHIEAHESAPEGVVRHLTVQPDKLATVGFTQRDAIICRLNKPMVRLAFDLIRAGIPCRIEGRDIGRTLVSVAKKAGVGAETTMAEAREMLDEWLTAELAEAERKESEGMRQSAEDKFGALQVFIERVAVKFAVNGPTPANGGLLFAEIEEMFADDVSGKLVLSSIHKAKGREWKRVFWLQAEITRRKPMQPWEVETEICCNYVAITRAQEELTYLTVAN